jgi:hypothetical protein
LLVALAVGQDAHAQDKRIELSATVGSRFGGSLDVGTETVGGPQGTLSFDSAVSYGGILGVRVQPTGFAFLSYSRQETTAHFRQFADEGTIHEQARASIEYFQLGGNLEFPHERLIPYFGLSIGPARFAALDHDSADQWFFSAVLDGGIKIELLPSLYLRVLGRMPVTFQSGSVYCYPALGCLVALHGTPLVQGEVHGGVTVAF